MASLVDALRQYADDFTGSLNPELKGYFDWRNANAEQTKKTFRDMASGEVTPEIIDQSFDLVTPIGGITKVAKGLGRAERAAEQGFDDAVWYRGLREAHDPAKEPSVIWASKSPDYASGYAYGGEANNVMPLKIKSYNPFNFGFSDAGTFVRGEDISERLRRGLDHAYDNNYIGFDDLEDIYNKLDAFDAKHGDTFQPAWKFYQEIPDVKDILENMGYDAIKHTEGNADAIGVFSPSQRRSINAEFDPNKMNESDILASVLRGEQNYA